MIPGKISPVPTCFRGSISFAFLFKSKFFDLVLCWSFTGFIEMAEANTLTLLTMFFSVFLIPKSCSQVRRKERGSRPSPKHTLVSHTAFFIPHGAIWLGREQELRRMHGRVGGRLNQSLHNSVIYTNTQPGANPMDT